MHTLSLIVHCSSQIVVIIFLASLAISSRNIFTTDKLRSRMWCLWKKYISYFITNKLWSMKHRGLDRIISRVCTCEISINFLLSLLHWFQCNHCMCNSPLLDTAHECSSGSGHISKEMPQCNDSERETLDTCGTDLQKSCYKSWQKNKNKLCSNHMSNLVQKVKRYKISVKGIFL